MELKDNNNIEFSEKKQKKFSKREFGGAFGDWGTLIPFIIGYVSIVGLSPASIFFCLGITNILLGIRYNLPLPVQPQKTIGTVALFQKWHPNLVISTGLGTGIIWIILGFSKKLNNLVKKVPIIAVRGIQLGLALILGWAALNLFIDDLLLGFISIVIILLLIKNKPVPSAIILTFMGIFIIFLNGVVYISDIKLAIPMFDFQIPTWENILIGILVAGIGQLFLTLTNVMIATIVLVKDLFPEKGDVIDANSLALNMGVMNSVIPFL